MGKALSVVLGCVVGTIGVVPAALAQTAPAPSHPGHGVGGAHADHSLRHPTTGRTPSSPGQDAFGAIAEVVAILDADPATDWSRVDLERLRRHLIDMNEVMLRASVAATPVPAGLAMEVTGAERTAAAIRAMLVPHAQELDRMTALRARAEIIPGGVRLTVTARDASDAKAIARVRALGFAGLLALGAHHGPHHLAMARGDALPGHRH